MDWYLLFIVLLVLIFSVYICSFVNSGSRSVEGGGVHGIKWNDNIKPVEYINQFMEPNHKIVFIECKEVTKEKFSGMGLIPINTSSFNREQYGILTNPGYKISPPVDPVIIVKIHKHYYLLEGHEKVAATALTPKSNIKYCLYQAIPL